MAFVYDEDGLFDEHINADTVVWQRIETAHWQGVLRGLIEDHRTETNSAFAAELLAHWDHEIGNFWQVVPREMVSRLAHPLRENLAAAE
jgi:glutamate synthase (NADPH) large chain